MVSAGLVDVWRWNNPLQKNFTWFQGSSEKSTRLDYFLASSNVPDTTVGVGIEPADNLSDHGATWSDGEEAGKVFFGDSITFTFLIPTFWRALTL